MSTRLHNWVWFVLAFTMAMQSLEPAAALADVTMRCAGAAPAAAPCVRMTVPVMQVTRATASMAAMSCCRAMGKHCPMITNSAASVTTGVGATPSRSAVSLPRCIVCVTVSSPQSPSSRTLTHRRMLASAPAIGPPAREISLVFQVQEASRRLPTSGLLPSHLLRAAYGLRGPPAA